MPALLATLLLSARLSPAQETTAEPLAASEAARQFELPEGFRATLFAGEPDVVQPIAFALDGRGRLWVVESLSYPSWREDGQGRDRVVILEDTDGDGRHDTRKVFWDRGGNLSGIELGFGGVWLCATPDFIFVPDRDGDDRPDGPPVTLLDGWDVEARHNVFNGLTWGPDGWLYGCNGILSNSLVGPPDAPESQRTPLNCGAWRYHPTEHRFEVVAWGTTNPWGLDFDEHGQMFITNCVIEHVFHVVPGAHFKRMYGQDLNPHVYELMQSCADHLHWAGGYWKTSLGGVHTEAGGGHAHAGAMIYLGDNWPSEYRNGLFTVNIHGQRVNHDRLKPSRSGYLATHAPDQTISRDPWFRGLELKYGPDGGVYLSDWSDTGECHDYTEQEIERGTGRIFKIVHGRAQHEGVDIGALKDQRLAELQLHENEWYVRQARRELQRRAAERSIDAEAVSRLQHILDEHLETPRRLRALWALYSIGQISDARLQTLLEDPVPAVRGWAVRLAVDDGRIPSQLLDRFTALAADEPAASVRLELASALQKLPHADRWRVAERLAQREEDRSDPNLPLMIWYGIEPLVPDNQGRDMALLGEAEISEVRRFATRKIAAVDERGVERLLAWLVDHGETAARASDVLSGIYGELRGRRNVTVPAAWRALYPKLADSSDPAVRRLAAQVGLAFDDARVVARLRQIVDSDSRPADERRDALELLVQSPRPQLLPWLQSLVADADVSGPALRGLAFYDDARTPQLIIDRYSQFDSSTRQDAIATLASRENWAQQLLDAMQQERIPSSDVSAYTALQLRRYENASIDQRLDQLWGSFRSTSQEKREQISRLKGLLTPETIATADPEQGRLLFDKHCASCHRLFDRGGAVGPDLTGSQRRNVDYVLENVVDPSAVVPGDYRVVTALLASGRVITGIRVGETERTVTFQTANERIVVDKEDIDELADSQLSMMPEGLFDRMTIDQLRHLFAYLAQ